MSQHAAAALWCPHLAEPSSASPLLLLQLCPPAVLHPLLVCTTTRLGVLLRPSVRRANPINCPTDVASCLSQSVAGPCWTFAPWLLQLSPPAVLRQLLACNAANVVRSACLHGSFTTVGYVPVVSPAACCSTPSMSTLCHRRTA